ncbi:MAG: excinuclease subunit [Phycisphaerales bacterium]|nr:excinuclease subunit [Phycisphaerales bacterium]
MGGRRTAGRGWVGRCGKGIGPVHLKRYYVNLLANRSHTLYVGVTSDLETRVLQHKRKAFPGFTATYNISRLVHYEAFRTSWGAIEREKELKGWVRAKKVSLIESGNKYWRDLARDWYPDEARGTAKHHGELGR